jgi:hypothetical protein
LISRTACAATQEYHSGCKPELVRSPKRVESSFKLTGGACPGCCDLLPPACNRAQVYLSSAIQGGAEAG